MDRWQLLFVRTWGTQISNLQLNPGLSSNHKLLNSINLISHRYLTWCYLLVCINEIAFIVSLSLSTGLPGYGASSIWNLPYCKNNRINRTFSHKSFALSAYPINYFELNCEAEFKKIHFNPLSRNTKLPSK